MIQRHETYFFLFKKTDSFRRCGSWLRVVLNLVSFAGGPKNIVLITNEFNETFLVPKKHFFYQIKRMRFLIAREYEMFNKSKGFRA